MSSGGWALGHPRVTIIRGYCAHKLYAYFCAQRYRYMKNRCTGVSSLADRSGKGGGELQDHSKSRAMGGGGLCGNKPHAQPLLDLYHLPKYK